MEKINSITISGIFKTETITTGSSNFTKQFLEINSKNREGAWTPAQFDMYIKPDLIQSSGLQEGQEVKISGWIAFNFAQNGRSFPKMVVTEIVEIGQASQPQQPQQPTYAAPQTPQSYAAPQVPQGGMPPMPPQQPQQMR